MEAKPYKATLPRRPINTKEHYKNNNRNFE